MKILHLIYTSGISGAEKYLKHLLPGLQQYGIHAHLIVVCPKKNEQLQELASGLKEQGVPTNLIATSRPGLVLTAGKIGRYCKTNGIHVIHSHLINTDVVAFLVKAIFARRITLISTKHGYDERVLQDYDPATSKPQKTFYYRVAKYLQKSIDKNIAVSKGMADLYFNLGLSDVHFPVLHHGVNIPPFNPADYKAECRRANLQLVIVGRIVQFKGHHYLIQAMKKVVKEFPDCKLLILGDGNARKQLEAETDALNLKDNIDFLGFQPHPYSYISNSDIVILPSLFEPFGLVYIEAFALKVPVVAFDTAAGNEIMENNVTALMVEKGNSKELAEKIIYLLHHKEERQRLSEAAYTVYQEKFTTGMMIKKTAEWYRNNVS